MTDRILGEGIAKQELNLIFIIDKSGSMYGEKIAAVNNAIRDIVSIMPEIQDDTADANIKISALTFSDYAEWIYPEPRSVDDFKWQDISVDGGTNFSDAYDKLTDYMIKKSKGGQMPDLGGVAPILILMTDGVPTSLDWEEHLNILKKRGWFKVALKYALAIGEQNEEIMNVLSSFTGNIETVLKVYTAEALRKVIKVIAVTASKVKSNSSVSNSTGITNSNDVAKAEIKENLNDIDDIEF